MSKSNKTTTEPDNETPSADNQDAETSVAETETPALQETAETGPIIDDRKPQQPIQGDYKAAPMNAESAKAFNDREGKSLTGDYTYLGATTHFQCRGNKDRSLVRGKTYDISELPKHEIVGNAILRRLLVKADTQTKTEA